MGGQEVETPLKWKCQDKTVQGEKREPVLHDARRAEMRREFERRMAEGAGEGLWRFVGEEEWGTGIGAEDWRDMTHVNAAGRAKMTRAMGRVLQGK